MSERAALEDGRHLLFIVGHYKSGSTWLLQMLSLHPAIRGLSETHIFYHVTACSSPKECTQKLVNEVPWSGMGHKSSIFYRMLQAARNIAMYRRASVRYRAQDRFATYLDLSRRDRARLREELLSSESDEEFCRRFFQFQYEQFRPERYLLEKTPDNIHRVPMIRSIFPQSQLVAIYRDGRDVVVSDRFFSRNQGTSWDLKASVLTWRSAMEDQIKYGVEHGLYACSYESLMEDGAGTLRNLLTHLDLDASDGLVEDLVHRSSFQVVSGRRPGEEKQSSFNRKGVVGDWRNHFTPEDKATFKELAGDMLIQLGYEQDDRW